MVTKTTNKKRSIISILLDKVVVRIKGKNSIHADCAVPDGVYTTFPFPVTELLGKRAIYYFQHLAENIYI